VGSIRAIGKFPRLLSHLSDYVRTNLTSNDVMDLALDYQPAIKHVDTLFLQGSGKMINGIYYYIVQPEERQKIQEQLVKHLQAT
jgi:polyisoprenyl-teichoic acid--peptidoglycan teichoic acid transferase